MNATKGEEAGRKLAANQTSQHTFWMASKLLEWLCVYTSAAISSSSFHRWSLSVWSACSRVLSISRTKLLRAGRTSSVLNRQQDNDEVRVLTVATQQRHQPLMAPAKGADKQSAGERCQQTRSQRNAEDAHFSSANLSLAVHSMPSRRDCARKQTGSKQNRNSRSITNWSAVSCVRAQTSFLGSSTDWQMRMPLNTSRQCSTTLHA